MTTKRWIIVLLMLLAISLTVGIFLLGTEGEASRAEIWSNGELLYTLDLHFDQTLTVHNGDGTNVIAVQDGKIAVTHANCPDGYCVARGFCSGGTQIVCLPNRLVIKFLSESEVDMVVG